MTSTLLVLLLLSQAERPDDPPAGAMGPPLPPSMAGGWHYLTRLEVSGLALPPSGEAAGVDSYAQLTTMLVLDGGHLYSGEVRWRLGEWLYALGQGGKLLRPGAFASLGLGVDHAR